MGDSGRGSLGQRKDTYIIIHIRRAQQPDCNIIRELHLIDIRAILLDMATIIDMIIRAHQARPLDPVPRLLGVLEVRIIRCIASQPGANIEETSVRNRVLIVISDQVGIDLPSQSMI